MIRVICDWVEGVQENVMYLRTLVFATAFQYCMLCSLKSVGGLRIVLKGVSSSAVRDCHRRKRRPSH